MELLALNLHPKPPLYPRRPPLPPRPFGLHSANLSQGMWPFRGLFFSSLVHEAALFSILLLPLIDRFREPPPPSNDYIFAIDLNSRSRLVYFPPLKDRDEGEKPKSERKPAEAKQEPAKPKEQRASTKGLSYPGPQEIVSDPPNPTNQFQTLLQPALVNPPVIHPPIPLPNLIQMTDAGPLSQPLPPRPEPTPLRKDLSVPAPSQAAAQRPNVVVPNAAQAPALPTPEKPAEPPTPLRRELSVSAPTLSASQRPKVILPLADPSLQAPEKPAEPPTPLRRDLSVSTPTLTASQRANNVALPVADPSLPAPEKPIELTAAKKDLAIPSPTPSQVTPSPRQPVAVPGANTGPALPTPQRPVEPPTVARRDLAVPSPSAPPSQIAAVETHGLDRQNLISINPLPPPPQQSVTVPAAEARGRFAISPDGNLTASSSTPGGKTDTPSATAIGAGTGNDTRAGSVAGTSNSSGTSGTAANSGARGGNSGDSVAGGKDDGKGGTAPGAATGTGNGTSAGNGTGNSGTKSPFPGITIQGGRLEGAKTGVVTGVPPTPSRPVVVLPKPGAAAAAPNTAYGMTIVSTVGSGGGLPNLGVFSAEQVVYTVYLDMKQPNGPAVPSWPLQYALLSSANSPTGVIPPFPMEKEWPKLPPDLVKKYLKQMVVVYAVVNAEGKLQDVSVKQTPDAQLNASILAALSKWVFRPAQVNDNPAVVKILLGVPLVLP
jgi:hypothetical protein